MNYERLITAVNVKGRLSVVIEGLNTPINVFKNIIRERGKYYA